MPSTLTYPGVYVEEVPSGVHTITGVPTSIAAFVGRTARGPENEQTTVTSLADFERQFGGLDVHSPVSYAVRDFFLNGGGQAVIVRLFHRPMSDTDAAAARAAATTKAQAVADAATGADAPAAATAARAKAGDKPKDDASASDKAAWAAADAVAAVAEGAAKVKDAKPADVQAAARSAVAAAAAQAVPSPSADLTIGTAVTLQAASPGSWGQYLRGQVDFDAAALKAAKWETTPWLRFNLTVRDPSPGDATETYQNLSTDPKSPRRVDLVLKNQSALVVWQNWTKDTATTLNPALADALAKSAAVATAQAAVTSDPATGSKAGDARNTL